MTFQNPDKTFADQAKRVDAFYQLCADVRDRHQKGEHDTRAVNLNNICMAANAAAATLRVLHWAKHGGGEGTLIAALGLSKPESINLVADDLLRATRLHLLVETQFQLETMFRSLLTTLGKPTDKAFYIVARDLITAAGVPDAAVKMERLYLPALIRNSMHANGIHNGYKGSSTVVIVDGVEFRFDHNKRVQCGSWYHIGTALTGAVAVVAEILSSTPVARLGLVEDRYAVLATGKVT